MVCILQPDQDRVSFAFEGRDRINATPEAIGCRADGGGWAVLSITGSRVTCRACGALASSTSLVKVKSRHSRRLSFLSAFSQATVRTMPVARFQKFVTATASTVFSAIARVTALSPFLRPKHFAWC